MILSFLTPKPPVPAVPKAVQTASNRGMFPIRRNRMFKRVSKMYIR